MLIVQQTQKNLHGLLLFLGSLWAIFFLNYFLNNRLLWLGIIPRRIYGLPGIIFAPLLHANFNHLFFNSIPLVVLANFLLISQGKLYFILSTVIIILLSGFLTWCFGKTGIHVGASALITGYWALLVSDIVQLGNLTAIILGLLSLYYFAGIFLGIFPGKKGSSWEGHLFGLLAGFSISYFS